MSGLRSAWAARVMGPPGVHILICFLLMIPTLAVYWQVRGFDFIYYDDAGYVFDNPPVRNGWTLNGLRWAFTTQHSRHWHPLTWLSHMTDVEIFGLDPGRHHLSNLIFHLANTLLLFFVLKRMTGALGRSALVAGLFAVHPLHVETVAWVSDRKDLLCTLFWIIAMGAYVSYARRPGVLRYLSVFCFFTLAILSKSMALTLPVVLLLLDYWPLERFSRQWGNTLLLIAEKAGFFLIGGCALFIAVVSMYWLRSAEPWMVSTDWALIGKALIACVIYIYKMIWPVGLMVPYSDLGPIPAWQAGGAAILLTVITGVAFTWARKRPYFLFGWLWYLVTLSPVMGLVYGSPQRIADRYTYLPLIGLFVVVVWGLHDMAARIHIRAPLRAVLSAVLILVLTSISWVQTGHWRSSFTLLRHALTLNPHNYVAMNSLANILMAQGDFKGAVSYYSQAVLIKPDYAKAHTNLGAALRELGEGERARRHYEEALRIDPMDWKARFNMANLLAEKGDLEAAISNYREALRINPDYAKAHNNLGVALVQKEGVQAAIGHYLEAVRIAPDFAEAHYNLGRAMAEQGDLERAKAHYLEAIRIKPHDTRAIRDLETLNAETRKSILTPEGRDRKPAGGGNQGE